MLSTGILEAKTTIMQTKRAENVEPPIKRRAILEKPLRLSLKDNIHSEQDLNEDSAYPDDFCFWCDAKRYENSFKCPYHENQPSKENRREEKKKPYAYQDIPNTLQLCTVKTPSGFERTTLKTVMQLPAGAWIGPYEGRLVTKDEAPLKNDFMWEIFKDGKLHGYIDGTDESKSSWMRFIGRAKYQEQQNLWAFQYQDKIFYRAEKSILPGQELTVWYDQEYTKFANGNQFMAPRLKSLSSPFQETSQLLHQAPQNTLNRSGTTHLETTFTRIGALMPSPTKLIRENNFSLVKNDESQTTPTKPAPRVSTGFSLKITDSKMSGRTESDSSSVQSSSAQSPLVQSPSVQSPSAQSPLVQSPTSPTSSDSGLSFGSADSPTKTEMNDSWQCGQCHKSFAQRGMLQVHVCANAPFKPFKCGHCDKSFTSAGQMRAHAVIHQGKKPFKCGYCARSFTGATTLNNHIRIHTGEKPFKCEKCGKTFSQGSQLSKHEKIPGDCKPKKH